MKQETLDSYEKAVNGVIEYINQHLYSSLDVAMLAGIANLSEFHFHRIFKSIIGENVGEYIIRLRLEGIASHLKLKPYSLEELAAQSSYQTKHAIAKAFKKRFGVTPAAFHKQTAYTYLSAKTEKEILCPEIKMVEDKQVVYIRIIDTYGADESYRSAWQQLGNFGLQNGLLSESTEWIGLSFDDPDITENEKCRFYACFTTKEKVRPSGAFGEKTIKGGLYAVFTLKGSYRGLGKLYQDICISWLPTSGYSLRKGYSFEAYLNHPDKVSEDKLLTEVYIPIEDKRTNLKE